MNTPPDNATVEMSYMARTNSALMTMAPTMASWKRRADDGRQARPAARSSSNACEGGLGIQEHAPRCPARYSSAVAVFFTTDDDVT